MAEMALGYGSEFQLLRFLGHHREELNKMILVESGIKGPVSWLDYPYESDRITGDGELKGIQCFEVLENYESIQHQWKLFWPQSGNAMNWDGVCRIGKTWLFVEAKANANEARQRCTASSENSKILIDSAFKKTQEWLKTGSGKWIETDCYQLANRLAFIYFCNSVGIDAKVLYISFVNGYWKKNVNSVDEWKTIWDDEYETLGIDREKIKHYLLHIYPDCEPRIR